MSKVIFLSLNINVLNILLLFAQLHKLINIFALEIAASRLDDVNRDVSEMLIFCADCWLDLLKFQPVVGLLLNEIEFIPQLLEEGFKPYWEAVPGSFAFPHEWLVVLSEGLWIKDGMPVFSMEFIVFSFVVLFAILIALKRSSNVHNFNLLLYSKIQKYSSNLNRHYK